MIGRLTHVLVVQVVAQSVPSTFNFCDVSERRIDCSNNNVAMKARRRLLGLACLMCKVSSGRRYSMPGGQPGTPAGRGIQLTATAAKWSLVLFCSYN